MGHIAYVGKMTNLYKIYLEYLKTRDHGRDLQMGGRILKWVWVWTGQSGSGQHVYVNMK
jgi:hypothetical protein